MDEKKLGLLLEQVKTGECGISAAIEKLKSLPSEDLGFACIDHHRALRTGIPEVVFGENKTSSQICEIFARMLEKTGPVMATRVSAEKAGEVCRIFPEALYHDDAAIVVARKAEAGEKKTKGDIVVVSAGTSDIPVAEEVRVTAETLGCPVEAAYDIGVAGIHRLYSRMDLLAKASVLVVVAGMEGALPSVVAGLVDRPVIAVPTSVGYGTGFGGIAALLGMLNSCAPGMAVVNIDNGFGAACMACMIAGLPGQNDLAK